MSAPAGWSDNHAEQTSIWTTETASVPQALNYLANVLDDDPDLLLIAFYVTPDDPLDPSMFVVQATVTRLESGVSGE